jgi:hypothetical protein
VAAQEAVVAAATVQTLAVVAELEVQLSAYLQEHLSTTQALYYQPLVAMVFLRQQAMQVAALVAAEV